MAKDRGETEERQKRDRRETEETQKRHRRETEERQKCLEFEIGIGRKVF